MTKRRSGILLHVTSLPAGYGVGDLGPAAYAFADFLERSGQSLWQILPLNPTDSAYGHSPYHSLSSFGFNPLLISPELLVQDGLLQPGELPDRVIFPTDRAEYDQAAGIKDRLFHLARERFFARGEPADYEGFCREHGYWLDDFTLFVALKSRFDGRPWDTWPKELRDREPSALDAARESLRSPMEHVRFLQYLFHRQWTALRLHCKERGIAVIGDMPIYVVRDSVDVWVSPEIFNLDENGKPLTVAGVPPDYFSETGQLWGNPVYRWDVLRDRGYDWWIRRIRHHLALFDWIRVDHFRGFVGYWEIPVRETTAVNGRWVEAPARDFFECVLREVPGAPILAEDLGLITPDVHEVMEHFGFPGMKVLLFAFGPDLPVNPYAPHNLERNCVVYTGTHDNNTARGWFEDEASPEDRARLSAYVDREVTPECVARTLIRLAMGSVADTVVLSMADVLGLKGDGRMNRPATTQGNWVWRMSPAALDDTVSQDLRTMSTLYGRV